MKKIFSQIGKALAALYRPDPSYLRYSIDQLCCPSINGALLIRNGVARDLSELLRPSRQSKLSINRGATLSIFGSCLVIQTKLPKGRQ